MRITRREAIGGMLALGPFGVCGFANGAEKSVLLSEIRNPAELHRIALQMTLTGRMKVERDEKIEALNIEANGTFRYRERIDPVAKPIACRYYDEAISESFVAGERTKKILTDEHRGILIYQESNGPVHLSPTSPLTREELEIVSEHWDSLAIPGLLPSKAVTLGETWAIPNDVAQTVCHFDGLIKNELVGKLSELTEPQAIVTVSGKAEGVENGAGVRLQVVAKLTIDLAKRFVGRVDWQQMDEREAGPVSPAMDVKVGLVLTRTRLAATSQEDSRDLEALLAKRPTGAKIPDLLVQLRHADANGFEFVYPRDWHIVVMNQKHLVMRLLNRGEYIAQATFASWKPTAGIDAKAILAEFVEATRKQPGWEPEKVLENGPMMVGDGRAIYRLSARGKQDGHDVVQSFHLLEGGGKHLAIATVCNVNAVEKLGTRDVALVSAVEFPQKK